MEQIHIYPICKCRNKNVGNMAYKNVEKPTFLFCIVRLYSLNRSIIVYIEFILSLNFLTLAVIDKHRCL